jgi:RNA polymerase sigma-70 factor, ECF subfamily
MKSHSDKNSNNSKMIPDERNLSKIMPVVYEELRRLAHRYMARENNAQTLQATALVNEAYLKLMKEKAPVWQNRAHFCAIAANAMRELLVERARARAAQKRGGSRIRISLHEAVAIQGAQEIDILALHEALNNLGAQDSELARIVELRFFGGLSIEETAEVLGCSPATVKRGWSLSKAWLKQELETLREP